MGKHQPVRDGTKSCCNCGTLGRGPDPQQSCVTGHRAAHRAGPTGRIRDEGSCLQPARRLSEDSVEVIRGFSESGSEPAKMAPRSPSHLSGKRVMGTPSSGETGSTRVRVVTCQHHEFVGHPRVNARATRQRYARLSWQLSDLVPLTGSLTGHGSPTCQALMWNRHHLRSQPVRHSAAVGG